MMEEKFLNVSGNSTAGPSESKSFLGSNRVLKFQSVLRVVLGFGLFGAMSPEGQAALILSYSGGTVQAGGSGTLDVFVSSDADMLTPDNLASFSAHFVISPVSGSGLQFSDPQSDEQLADISYIFYGDSLASLFNIPVGTVSLLPPKVDYIGGDGTVSPAGVNLDSSSGSFLLFRLNLDAALASVGSMFTVSLINDGSTSFLDSANAEIALVPSSFNGFTVTAVPEPSTGSMLLLASIGTAWYRRRKTLRNAAVAGK